MRMIRSLIFVGLALAAMAFTISAPAVAATPTDPGIYNSIKASLDAPAILQVYDDHDALTCEATASHASRADGRSSYPVGAVNIADMSSARIHLVELRRRC